MIHSLLAILAGLLLGIPFKFPSLALLSWVGLIPFLFALEGENKKRSFYLGWIMGLSFLAISSYWLVNPLINFSGYPLAICILIFILAISILSLYFALFAFILKTVESKLSLPVFIVTPIIWTAVEFLRSIFSFQFLFAFLAYSQSFIPELIQLAEYGGLYLVTFIIVLVNTLLYLFIKKRNKSYGIIAISIFVLVFSYGYLVLKQNNNTSKEVAIGIVQPNIPQNIKMSSKHQRDVVDKLLKLSSKELEKNDPDLLIWPETAILRTYYKSRGFPYHLPKDTPLFIGGFAREGENLEKTLNSSFLFDENRRIVDRYSKNKLVPWGEYVPFPNLIPDIIESNLNHLTPGKELNSFNYNKITWVSPICSEVLNPFYVRDLYDQNDFMINISNEAWFEESHASLQVLQAVIFRAVEHRAPIVKVGNTGISGVIDQNGKVLIRTDIFETKTLTFNLAIPVRKETIYYKYGNLFGWTLLLITFFILSKVYLERKEFLISSNK
ncbi:apolipoprotein N-acyltransferase [Orenia marismortui]|uniref:Apolipoprotein N-acyltransferase n=1 Tax=Orenia marismortui TaxID=46469 RepID=A0A4V6QB99_9FIRM|nr:apolipoprotein N-acyltransferase [Orenia marismortui]TDX52324.1 apolipoprotein N-acyltransferase [Orenia marismortui]